MTETIQSTNRYALKEWAVVVKALSEGRQTLLFRKGGIIEEQGKFKVEHSEFFLYPTYLHEHARRIIPEALRDLEKVLAEKPSQDQVGLSVYGAVEEAIWVSELDRLMKLSAYHILSSEEIEKRFYYRNNPGLYVIIVRMHTLPRPHTRTVTPEYAGCKSWVDLSVELATAGARPVLSDAVFSRTRDQIQTVLL